ncbi:hypothetical protein [Xenorhabdus sp. SGI240]|uniref:hypothetical protein n=1 Tax=Xenorhabdus sp. SGI240 TaxID=3158262 RepID=UPI0032B878BB
MKINKGGYFVNQRIGESVLLNIISISQTLGMTKGAISKISAKLLQRPIVEKRHRQIEARGLQILENYSPEELMTTRRFIDEFGDRLDGHLWKSIYTKCNTGSMGSLKSAT